MQNDPNAGVIIFSASGHSRASSASARCGAPGDDRGLGPRLLKSFAARRPYWPRNEYPNRSRTNRCSPLPTGYRRPGQRMEFFRRPLAIDEQRRIRPRRRQHDFAAAAGRQIHFQRKSLARLVPARGDRAQRRGNFSLGPGQIPGLRRDPHLGESLPGRLDPEHAQRQQIRRPRRPAVANAAAFADIAGLRPVEAEMLPERGRPAPQHVAPIFADVVQALLRLPRGEKAVDDEQAVEWVAVVAQRAVFIAASVLYRSAGGSAPEKSRYALLIIGG